MSEAAVQEPAVELIDGLWVDVDTGEVVALERMPDFQVVDDESAEWVLKKLMNAEADLASIEAREAAVMENFRLMKAQAQRRIDGIKHRFGSDLEHYAMTALDGQKTKTLRLAYGSLSFRTVKGGLRVAEGAEAKRFALAWAKRMGYDNAVVTKEEFQISKLEKDQSERFAHLVELGMTDPDIGGVRLAFEIKPEADVFTIKTGIDKAVAS